MTPRDVWERFDDEVSDGLLRALAAAFALVATADVEIAEAEVQRFLQMVRSDSTFQRVSADVLEPHFRELTRAMLDNPQRERDRALALIRETSPQHAELIVAAAQMAIVADEHLMNVEELALREICEAVGLDSSTR